MEGNDMQSKPSLADIEIDPKSVLVVNLIKDQRPITLDNKD